jgi:predicted nuclease of predicted toxin-antitoxin system
MLRLLTDENFNGALLRGLLRLRPGLDVVRVQDVDLLRAEDPTILEWAAGQGRILLTHDVATITRFAYERVTQGLPMPGVIEVTATAPIGKVLQDLLLVCECSRDGEWEGKILYLPLP